MKVILLPWLVSRPLRLRRNELLVLEQQENPSAAMPDGDDDDEASMDEFTRTYLEEEDVRKCPGCGAWIVKEDGCNNMMCRCGCRFCFCCGDLICCFGGGTFYDNVLGCDEEDEEDVSYHSEEFVSSSELSPCEDEILSFLERLGI
jgi:hypothetical protein